MRKIFIVFVAFIFLGCASTDQYPDDSYLIPDTPWWLDDSLTPLPDLGKIHPDKSDMDVPMGQMGNLPAWSAPEEEPEEDLSEWTMTDEEWELLFDKQVQEE